MMANEFWIAATLFGLSTSAALAQDVAAGRHHFGNAAPGIPSAWAPRIRSGRRRTGSMDGVWKHWRIPLFRSEQKLSLHLERGGFSRPHQGSETENPGHKEVVFRRQRRDRGAEFVVVSEAVRPRWPTAIARDIARSAVAYCNQICQRFRRERIIRNMSPENAQDQSAQSQTLKIYEYGGE
jgi:hypothetical protein